MKELSAAGVVGRSKTALWLVLSASIGALVLWGVFRLDIHRWHHMRTVKRIVVEIGAEPAFAHVAVHLGKPHGRPIVLYGEVPTENDLQALEALVQRFAVPGQIDFRVRVRQRREMQNSEPAGEGL